ncbi:MAG: MoxR family ATPase [Oscillospiraceae bacterium]
MEKIESRVTEQSVTAARKIIDEVKNAVKGKDEIIERVLLAILSRGHILLEDIPGVGKTTLAIAFSKAMQLDYNRVQFTPDVMPSDVTGFSMYKKSTDSFEFVKGAVLCNLFLADEINRTSSKTQSALLEVMEEGRVTVDLKTYETPKPFTVIATQNPIGYAGTQMLPESQLDRFIVRLSMGYPDANSELQILKSKGNSTENNEVNAVVSSNDIIKMQEEVDDIFVHDSIYAYIISLVEKTRQHELIELGASPRGTIALMRMAKAKAFMSKRDYVIPADVQYVMECTLVHRLVLKPKAKISNTTSNAIIEAIRLSTATPKLS